MTIQHNPAPGHPGIKAKWTSSAKSGIGKALNAGSDIVFSLSHGIVNEVYFPREDIPCIRDLGLIVADGDEFFSEEKRHTNHMTETMGDGVPAYRVVNTCVQYKYKVTKEVVADPLRSVLLQQVRFDAADEADYHVYAQLAPHLNNEGDHNTGWTGMYKGIEMLLAEGGGLAVALACSTGWLKRSAGYVGVSDGWTDLNRHKKMTWDYTEAKTGNIALTGEVNLSASGDFVLALGFGRNWEEAANHAWGSILEGFDSAKKRYIKDWVNWLGSLQNVKGENFRISAAVLRMNEAKTFPGGIVASFSIPWGMTKGDGDKGGYHLVWPRDLVESAGGFLALETRDDVLRIVNYLMSTQREDGSWPQNMWLEGTAYWKGQQTDQTALPILLMDKCNQHDVMDADRMARYWPGIKKGIHYLLLNGPYTQEDRWEEEKGFTPFTLAAVIAGLLSGAEIADLNNDPDLADYCRETADTWNDMIEQWIYVTNTPLAEKTGVDGYYIRINPFYDIVAGDLGDRTIDLKNHHDGAGRMLLNELVCVDALALVRFGLRDADDPKILDTIKVIDAILKVDTPHGPCWHRYNNDGYGEDAQGNAYDGAGIGRAWPLLTAERAHYEIAAGNITGAKSLLKTVDAFANNGLLSEQIWDTDDIPSKELFWGKHSGSAMPLTWAHAEYIKLCASIRDKKVFDMPKHTRKRYLKEKRTSPFEVWRFMAPRKSLSAGKILRIELMAGAVVHWTDDAWATVHETPAQDRGMGIFVADLPAAEENHGELIFTFFWKLAKRWENKNYTVIRHKPMEKPPGVMQSAGQAGKAETI
ncbi:MAG TPA: glycoside hydrolase family 15 protein [Puia sp.]